MSNRDDMLNAIVACAAPGMELRYDGTEDPVAAAYVAGVQAAHDAAREALERHDAVAPQIPWSVLRGARGRLAALYMAGSGGTYGDLDVRRSIEDIDEVLQAAEKAGVRA